MSIIKVLAVGLSIFLGIGILNAQDSIHLTKKQEKFLSKKTVKTHVMGQSTFNSFADYMYALDIANIQTDNPEVGSSKLQSLPDPNRQISLRELFDEIAKQTSSKWTYDEENGYWLFSKPLPYEIVVIPGWKKEVRPGYIFYKPPSAPVGMDIYFAGRIDSSETSNEALNRIAEQFAKPITPDIDADSMKKVSLLYHNALYYKTEIQKRGIIWRQWAIAEKDMCFMIVSAIKLNDEATVFPDVEKMVRSFKVTDREAD